MPEGEALGMVETRGFVALVDALDQMVKAARVRVTRVEGVSDGRVTVLVRGRLAAVRFAVEAGERAARRVGGLVASRVIANPSDLLEPDLIRQRSVKEHPPAPFVL